MMPLWIAGVAAMGFAFFLTEDPDSGKTKIPVQNTIKDVLEVSHMLIDIKEDEALDANYLLGCHAQKDVVKLHFCYEAISGKTILGFYEAFRHGNTLLNRHMEEPNDLVFDAAGLIVSRGLKNYNRLADICDAGDCAEDVGEYVRENKGFARSLRKKAESLSAIDSIGT